MRNHAVLSFRIPEEMEKKLEELSKRTEKPKSYFIRKALEEYLEDIEDYADALDRYTRANAEYLTTEEVKKSLGI